MKRAFYIIVFLILGLNLFGQSPSLKIIECSSYKHEIKIDIYVEGDKLYKFYEDFNSTDIRASYFVKFPKEDPIILPGKFIFENNGREVFCSGRAWSKLEDSIYTINLLQSEDLKTHKYDKLKMKFETPLLSKEFQCVFLME